MPDLKITARIPEDISAQMDKYIAAVIERGLRRRYSKNDCILDGLQALFEKEKPSGRKNKIENP